MLHGVLAADVRVRLLGVEAGHQRVQRVVAAVANPVAVRGHVVGRPGGRERERECDRLTGVRLRLVRRLHDRIGRSRPFEDAVAVDRCECDAGRYEDASRKQEQDACRAADPQARATIRKCMTHGSPL